MPWYTFLFITLHHTISDFSSPIHPYPPSKQLGSPGLISYMLHEVLEQQAHVCGVWNTLPHDLKYFYMYSSFESRLKTHLFPQPSALNVPSFHARGVKDESEGTPAPWTHLGDFVRCTFFFFLHHILILYTLTESVIMIFVPENICRFCQNVKFL